MPRKILVPTDLSESSIPGLELAIGMAGPLEAELVLYYVVATGPLVPLGSQTQVEPIAKQEEMRKQALDALAALGSSRNIDRPLQYATGLGLPSEEIVRHAREDQVDLIVMATHGRSGLAHLLMGSCTERVLRGAHCPVLAVRSGGPYLDFDETGRVRPESLRERSGRSPKQILVPIDLSEGSLPALIVADQMAEKFNAGMTIVHVVEIAYSTLPLLSTGREGDDLQTDMLRSANDSLRTFLTGHSDSLSHRTTAAKKILLMGEVGREIELTARKTGADLIVMGRHGRRGFRRWLMGSVAEQVVRNAPCPVATVPQAEE